MASQICRPWNSLAIGRSGETSRRLICTSVPSQRSYRQRQLLCPANLQLSGSGLRTVQAVSLFPPRIDAKAAAHDFCDDKQHPKQDEKLTRVLKLIVPLIPAMLLAVRPAFASTVAIKVAGNTAKGFRVPELVASAWTGLMAGCLHTLTGPDHLAALAPLSIGRTKMEGAVVGALWGCGHDAGQIIFGLLFLLLKDRLHIDLVRTWSARIVGVTLLAIGAMGIKEAQETPVPCLAGEECEAEYETTGGQVKKPFGLATFATGIVHGLQPDALLVILPALALPSRIAGIAFLFMFLLGTVLAMASYTAFVGSCSEALQKRVPWITQRLSWGSSLIAIGVGISILLGEVFGINIF